MVGQPDKPKWLRKYERRDTTTAAQRAMMAAAFRRPAAPAPPAPVVVQTAPVPAGAQAPIVAPTPEIVPRADAPAPPAAPDRSFDLVQRAVQVPLPSSPPTMPVADPVHSTPQRPSGSAAATFAAVAASLAEVPAPDPIAPTPVAPSPPHGPPPVQASPQLPAPGVPHVILDTGPAYLVSAGVPPAVMPPAWRLMGADLPAALPVVSQEARDSIAALHREIARVGPQLPQTRRAGARGVSLPLGRCHDRGVSELRVMQGNTLYPALYAAVVEFARHFYFLGCLAACVVNWCFFAGWHVDANNFPKLPSVITVGGNFAGGGGTQFRRPDGSMFEVHATLAPVAFDPTLQHRVRELEGEGVRTAAVFFMSALDSPQRVLSDPPHPLLRANRLTEPGPPPPRDPAPMATALLQAGGTYQAPAPSGEARLRFEAARQVCQAETRLPHPVVRDNSAAAGLSPSQEDRLIDELPYIAVRELKAVWRSLANHDPVAGRFVPADKPMQPFPPALRVEVLERLAAPHPHLTHDVAAMKAWLSVPLLQAPQVNWPRVRYSVFRVEHARAVRTICVRYRGPVVARVRGFALDRPGKPTARLVVDGRKLNSFLAAPPPIHLQSYDEVADLIGPYNVVGDFTSAFLQLPLGAAWLPFLVILRGYALVRMPPGLSCAAFCMQVALRVLLACFLRSDGHYDDFLIGADSAAEAAAAWRVMADRCREANVTVGKIEVVGGPFEHLGVRWDYGRNERSLPQRKLRKAYAACEMLRTRANASPLEVLQAVGYLFHVGEVLRVPVLFSGVWREVLSAVARAPMRTRVAAGMHVLADVPVDATVSAMREILARNSAPMRRPAPPRLPASVPVFACDAAIEPGVTTYTCVVRVHYGDRLEVRHCDPIPPGWRIEFAEAHAVAATLPLLHAMSPPATDVVYGEDNEVVRAALRNGWSRARGVSRVIRAVLSAHHLAGRRVWVAPVPSAGQCADVGTRHSVPLGEFTGDHSAEWWTYDRLCREAVPVN